MLDRGGGPRPRQRWAICSTTWHPAAPELDFLLSLLDPSEADACCAFVRFEDKKRAILSRLMARGLAAAGLGLPLEHCRIARTRGRKPFLANAAAADAQARAAAPNFNFNVSHEGDYVVGVSEPLLLCGVDIAAPPHVRRGGGGGGARPFLAAFEDKLTPNEWAFITAPRADDQILARFLRFWSMKEAFVKGRGDGLQFPLGSVEFRVVDTWQAAEDAWPEAREAQVGGGSSSSRGRLGYLDVLKPVIVSLSLLAARRFSAADVTSPTGASPWRL